MASLAVVFDLVAKDNASKELRQVGASADDSGKKFSGFAKAATAGALLVAGAAVKMAKDSVDAFVESEQSSMRLDAALKKFPKTNDVARSSFDKLNESLAKKTRFDDDATASGQAVLAQFGLTGTEIQKLTPLLQDYAAKTGKDLPQAATVLGKAMLGNAKALKEVGINLPPAADATKNLAKAQDQAVAAATKAHTATQQLDLLRASLSEKEKLSAADKVRLAQAEEKAEHAVHKHREALTHLETTQKSAKDTGSQFTAVTEALRKQVGGFAEEEGKTAAGQAEILKNRFGEVQEKIGAKLVPALSDLAGKLIQVIAFTERHHKVIVPLTAVIGGMTVAVLAVNAATVASSAVTAAATTVRGIFMTTTIAATGVEKASTIARIAGTVATTASTVAMGIATVATKAYTLAQLALNVALKANPIGLVITALGLLATGVVLAYQKSDTFREKVNTLWEKLKGLNDRINETGEKVRLGIIDKFESAKQKLGDFVQKMKDFKLPGWVKDLGEFMSTVGGGFKKLDPANWFGDGPGIGGSPDNQPRGVKAMMAALPQGTRLISGFRPGAITATGNPSYHGKGRAVDIPPSMALFNYIKSRFGAVSKELIFSPAGAGQIHNGKPHYYKGVTRANHFDHVHWAMDKGGVANGIGFMPKLTSRPERVLSPAQTAAFERLVTLLERGPTSGGGDSVALAGRLTRTLDGMALAARNAGGSQEYAARATHALVKELRARGSAALATVSVKASPIARAVSNATKVTPIQYAPGQTLTAGGRSPFTYGAADGKTYRGDEAYAAEARDRAAVRDRDLALFEALLKETRGVRGVLSQMPRQYQLAARAT